MNALPFILLLILSNYSSNALAHLKWFVGNEPLVTSEIQYTLLSTEVIVGIALLITGILIAVFLNKKIAFDFSIKESTKEIVIRIFSILIGLSLLFASYTESIIAAHYIVSNPVLVLLQYAQAIVALMLIFNVFTTYAAVALIVIYIVLGFQYGAVEILDYLNVLGIALFLVLTNRDRVQQQVLAVPAIRVLTGCALVVLAFSEKLLNPNLGLAFLATYDWNFMKTLGVAGYSNELFILSAGFVELLIGLLFIFGLVTRLNTIVLLSFMITSNVVFLIQNSLPNALTELAGHLPVIAIALILLSLGSGKKCLVKS